VAYFQEDFNTGAELKPIFDQFTSTLRTLGMTVVDEPSLLMCPLPPKADSKDLNRSDAIDHIEKTLKTLKAPPKLVFVILSNSDKSIYNGIKYLCDIKLDIHCVCVQAAKFKRGQVRPFLPCRSLTK
jgi:eukaryotic translation initiation factor 2C